MFEKLLPHVKHNIDVVSNEWTPLHCASRAGQVNMVRQLLEKGNANMHIRTLDGLSALLLACQENQVDVVRFFLEEQCQCVTTSVQTLLSHACRHDSVTVVQFLVEQHGADPFAQVTEEEVHGFTTTPLLNAAETGQLDILYYFIRQHNALAQLSSPYMG